MASDPQLDTPSRTGRDTARALAPVDSALHVTPLDSLLRGDGRYDELARFYLAAGQRERAELGWTLRRLGEVSERLGDSTRARRAREQLIELWIGPTPNFIWSLIP